MYEKYPTVLNSNHMMSSFEIKNLQTTKVIPNILNVNTWPLHSQIL